MQKERIVYSEFSGIARSLANPPENSLYRCDNLVLDEVSGGLVPRQCVRAIEEESTNLDGFTNHVLDDIDCRISIKDGHVYSKPFLYGGSGSNNDRVIDSDEALTGTMKFAGSEAGTKASGWIQFDSATVIPSSDPIGLIQWGLRDFQVSPVITALMTDAQRLSMGKFGILGIGTQFLSQLVPGMKISFVGQSNIDGSWTSGTFTVDAVIHNLFLFVKEAINFRVNTTLKQPFTIESYTTGLISDGDTVIVGSDTYTFKNTPTLTFHVQIANTAYTTAQNLINKINSAGISSVTASYRWNGDIPRVYLEYNTVGTAGNSITLSKSSSALSVSASTLLGGSYPSDLVQILSIVTNTITLAQPHPVDNGWYKYCIVRNKSIAYSASPDMQYAVVTSVSSDNQPILTLNKDVSTAWSVEDIIIFYRSDMQARQFDSSNKIIEALDVDYNINSPIHFVGLGGKNDLGVFGLSYNNKPLWIGKINNRSYFNNAFSYNGVYCTHIFDTMIGAVVSVQRPLNVKVDTVVTGSGRQNNVFQFAFGYKMDGFNESQLNNEGILGNPPTIDDTYPTSPNESNWCIFRDIAEEPVTTPFSESYSNVGELYDLNLPKRNSDATTVYTKATVKIQLVNGECINRRVTDIVLYARQLYVDFADSNRVLVKGAWRRVKVIPINNSSWAVDGTTKRYYIETVVTGDMLGGELFVDKLKYAPGESLVKDVVTATNVGRRVFAVDNDNRQIVYYSPINDNGECQSLLPSSSFFLLNKEVGDIVKLVSLNNKLVAFKRDAMFVVSIDGNPPVPKDDFISDKIGLAAINSIVIVDKVLYFVSNSGIYRTDGFKLDIVPLNKLWITDFKSYTGLEIANCISFYDKLTQSIYFWIKDIFWVYNILNNKWQRATFQYTQSGTTYGTPKFVSEYGNSVLIYDDSGEYIQFPSSDSEDSYFVGGNRVTNNFEVNLETNDRDSKYGLDVAMHVNSGYFRGENNTGFTLTIKDGETVRATQSVPSDRYVFPLTTRVPLSRIKMLLSAVVTGRFTIKDIGIETIQSQRTGSVKTL